MHRVSNWRFAPPYLLAAVLATALIACGSESRRTGGGTSTQEAAETQEPLLAGPACGPGERVIVAPPERGILHGAMPSLLHEEARSGPEAAERVRTFERLADRPLAWVYFSDNWF